VWRRQRWSFTAAFTDGNDDAMTDSGAYMLLWLEEGEGGQLRTKGLRGALTGKGGRRRGLGQIRQKCGRPRKGVIMGWSMSRGSEERRRGP
jgi:hypothetical protein